MKCYTCHKWTWLNLNNTANQQRDEFAHQHRHNPDWKRWTQQDK